MMNVCAVETYVDVIADTSAVLGWVVVAEHGQFISLAHRNLQEVQRSGSDPGGAFAARSITHYLLDVGHEVVGNATGVLADAAAGVGAHRVEVSEGHHVPGIGKRRVRPVLGDFEVLRVISGSLWREAWILAGVRNGYAMGNGCIP
jgi:hypothetical protein